MSRKWVCTQGGTITVNIRWTKLKVKVLATIYNMWNDLSGWKLPEILNIIDRHYTYNVKIRRFRLTTSDADKQ
jgi:hypothetical protein